MSERSQALAHDTALAAIANDIRARGRRVVGDVIEIGRHLTEAKALCSHGRWLPWLEREFGWSEQTALNLMRVYELTKLKRVLNLSLPLSGLYKLAAPSRLLILSKETFERSRKP
jgi:hypothetical protein